MKIDREYSSSALITAYALLTLSSEPNPNTRFLETHLLQAESQPALVQQFAEAFKCEYHAQLQDSNASTTATVEWNTLHDTVHRTVLTPFRRKMLKSYDWFVAKSAMMTPVIEAKRPAFAEYKRSPNKSNLQILRSARIMAERSAMHCANEYWTELSQTIQATAASSNIRGMYDGIKVALGPIQSRTEL